MWYLLGCRVSPKCLTALIGLGNARMGRVLSGGMDRRYRKWGGAPRFKLCEFADVYKFCMKALPCADSHSQNVER